MRPTRYSLPVNLLLADFVPQPTPTTAPPSDLTVPPSKPCPRPVARVIRLIENRLSPRRQDAGASV
ncbi:MAG: hypothetical protein ACT4QA_03055 [Panacagrimonas sp.]